MKDDKLRENIEKALGQLMNPKSILSADEKKELRENTLLAIKWEAVKHKTKNADWGSGFANGEIARDLEDEEE